MDLEEIIRDLVRAVLEGFDIQTQEEFQDKESEILGELDTLKDELEGYLLEAVEELPVDDSGIEFDSDEENSESDDDDDLLDED